MKRFALLSALILGVAFVFQSCRGPEGLPGPQGPEGPAGPEILPAVFDVSATFTAANQYRQSITMPSKLEVYDTDVVMVYLNYDVTTIGGKEAKIWRALPLVVPVNTGFFQYNFDFTQYDVEFFLEGTIDLTTLDNTWTKDQLFRVVVIPADKAPERKAAVDLSNYDEVAKAYGIDEAKVVKLEAR